MCRLLVVQTTRHNCPCDLLLSKPNLARWVIEVSDNVISYLEMCRRENASLQAGMNFGLGRTHSVILMSLRPNAPYRDRLEDGGTTLIYEGHDQPRTATTPNPKLLDQLERSWSGGFTQN